MKQNSIPSASLLTRHDLIRRFLKWTPGKETGLPASSVVFLKGDKCLYAIQLPVINAFTSSTEKDAFLSPEELQMERAFATHCSEQQILGFSCRGQIRYPLLVPQEKTSNQLDLERVNQLVAWTREHFSPGLQMDTITSLNVLQNGQDILSDFKHQQLAFQGWLLANTQFQQEKVALRSRWIKEGSNPAYLSGRNHLKQRNNLPAQAVYNWSLHSDIGDAFLGFYRRWELDGLATWDLPIQQSANIGGSGDLGQLMELNSRPTIQTPSSIRLPTKLHARHFLNDMSQDHLKEWQDIQKRQRTKRYAEGFVIHYYQEMVLRGILGDRLRRRQQLLDELIAKAFKHTAPLDLMEGINSETIKDIRQSYRRLLNKSNGS